QPGADICNRDSSILNLARTMPMVRRSCRPSSPAGGRYMLGTGGAPSSASCSPIPDAVTADDCVRRAGARVLVLLSILGVLLPSVRVLLVLIARLLGHRHNPWRGRREQCSPPASS